MNFICVALVAACCTVVQTQVTKPEGNVSKATTPVSTLVATPTLSSEVETTDGNVTTETALTTTCEANTTCLVSTVKPNANDTPVEANNTDVTVSKKTQHGIDVTSPGKELCTCNLQVMYFSCRFDGRCLFFLQSFKLKVKKNIFLNLLKYQQHRYDLKLSP